MTHRKYTYIGIYLRALYTFFGRFFIHNHSTAPPEYTPQVGLISLLSARLANCETRFVDRVGWGGGVRFNSGSVTHPDALCFAFSLLSVSFPLPCHYRVLEGKYDVFVDSRLRYSGNRPTCWAFMRCKSPVLAVFGRSEPFSWSRLINSVIQSDLKRCYTLYGYESMCADVCVCVRQVVVFFLSCSSPSLPCLSFGGMDSEAYFFCAWKCYGCKGFSPRSKVLFIFSVLFCTNYLHSIN